MFMLKQNKINHQWGFKVVYILKTSLDFETY